MFNSGYIESKKDENDIILDLRFEKSENIPNEYNFVEYLGIYPKNQGDTQKCVPYSLSTINKRLFNVLIVLIFEFPNIGILFDTVLCLVVH